MVGKGFGEDVAACEAPAFQTHYGGVGFHHRRHVGETVYLLMKHKPGSMAREGEAAHKLLAKTERGEIVDFHTPQYRVDAIFLQLLNVIPALRQNSWRVCSR